MDRQRGVGIIRGLEGEEVDDVSVESEYSTWRLEYQA